MAALDSRGTPDPRRELAPGTVAQLRDALLDRLQATPDAEARLAAVLQVAAAEARSEGVRPEHLIVALKRLSDDVELRERGTIRLDSDERRRVREWLVQASLQAYFQQS